MLIWLLQNAWYSTTGQCGLDKRLEPAFVHEADQLALYTGHTTALALAMRIIVIARQERQNSQTHSRESHGHE
jgi:hypothetical protein